MRLRRRSVVDASPAPAPPPAPEAQAQAPVAEAAFALREIVESIPGGDRERVWTRIVAAVEQGLPAKAADPPAADSPAAPPPRVT